MTDGMKAFILDLRRLGLTPSEIDRIGRRNPAGRLGTRTAAPEKRSR